MQHEVTVVQKLLDQQGYVVTPGWARRPVWQYNRENIAAPSFRIKEWDYYLAGNEHYAVAFTLSDLGYAGLISVSLIIAIYFFLLDFFNSFFRFSNILFSKFCSMFNYFHSS